MRPPGRTADSVAAALKKARRDNGQFGKQQHDPATPVGLPPCEAGTNWDCKSGAYARWETALINGHPCQIDWSCEGGETAWHVDVSADSDVCIAAGVAPTVKEAQKLCNLFASHVVPAARHVHADVLAAWNERDKIINQGRPVSPVRYDTECHLHYFDVFHVNGCREAR